MLHRFKKLLKIYPNEEKLIIMLIGAMMLATIGSSLGSASIDGLFFTQFDISKLPYIYVVLGTTNLFNMLLIAGLSGNISRSRLYTGLPILIAIVLIIARVILTFKLGWFYPVLFVAKEALMAIQSVFIWGMASSLLDARQAKRLYPLLTAGSITGATIGSFGTSLLVNFLPTENLFLVWAVALIFVTIIIVRLIVADKQQKESESAFVSYVANSEGGFASIFESIQQGYAFVRKSKLMSWWSLFAVLLSVLWFFFLLPFQQAISVEFPNADALAGFLGIFTGIQTASALIVSIFFSNRLFAKFGIMNMMLVFVLMYVVGFASLLTLPLFAVIVATRLVYMVWANSVAEPAWFAVFNAVPLERRDQTRFFVNAAPNQGGIVLSGILLIVVGLFLTAEQVYILGLVIALIAAFVILKARGAYLGALSDALQTGNATIFVEDDQNVNGFQPEGEALQILLANLKSKDLHTRRIAVEILSQVPSEQPHPDLIKALKDKSEDVSLAALHGLMSFQTLAALEPLTDLLASPNAEIREHAIEALQKFGASGSKVLTAVRKQLKDPHPAVQARAAVLLAFAEQDSSVADLLIKMASSKKTATRLQAVRAMAQCWPIFSEHKTFGKNFEKAFSDADAAVRMEAIRGLSQPPLHYLPYFLEALGDADEAVRRQAAESIRQFDSAALEPLANKLKSPQYEDAALLALFDMKVGSIELEIRDYIAYKVQLAMRDRNWAVSLRPSRNTIQRLLFLADALQARAREHAILALRGMDLLISDSIITHAIESIRASKQLDYAFEALESLPDTDLVRPLVRLWERTGSTVSSDEFPWAEALQDKDAWIRACVVFAIIPKTETSLIKKLAKSDPDELVRETANYTLARETMKTLKTLPMLERILFLQKIPLFAEMVPEDLKKVASVATEKFFANGAYLAKKGDAGHEMFIIISGEVQVLTEKGEQLAVNKAGDYTGEMSILSNDPRSASLLAKGDVRVLSIGQKEFQEILRERPDASLAVIRELCARLRMAG